MSKMVRRCVFSGMLVLSCAIGTYVFFVPTSINVKAESNRIYEMTDVEKKDIKVYSHTLSGIEKEVDDYKVENRDDDKTIVVTSGKLSQECVLNKIPVEYITAKYDGTVFPGDKISVDKFKVVAVYKDGTTKKLSQDEYTLENMPDVVEKDVSVKVKSDAGNASVKIRPVKVQKLEAVYDGGLKVGDTFDISKVKCVVTFEDGTSKEVADVTSDFKGAVALDSAITIKAGNYGETKLPVDTSGIAKFDIGYTKELYEGDELTPEILKITATMADGTTNELSGLAFDATHVFNGDVVQVKSEGLGSTLKCTIKLVKAVDFEVKASVKNDDTLNVKGITAVFEDGKKKDIDMSNVSFVTDMTKKLQTGENELKFKWFDHEFSTVVTYK